MGVTESVPFGGGDAFALGPSGRMCGRMGKGGEERRGGVCGGKASVGMVV